MRQPNENELVFPLIQTVFRGNIFNKGESNLMSMCWCVYCVHGGLCIYVVLLKFCSLFLTISITENRINSE